MLVLGQLALVGRLYGTDEASQFFVLWTVITAASVGVRFGFDLLLPKRAAVANLAGSAGELAGFRDLATRTTPLVVAASIPILLIVLPQTAAATALLAVPVVLLGAIGWAVVYVSCGLVRGYGHAGLSGWIAGPLASGLVAAAVPVAHALDGSWLFLGLLSSVALAAAGIASVFVAARVVGRDRTKVAMTGRLEGEADPDTWWTGTLFSIGEVNVVMPVWIAGALGLSGAEVGALYAALRVAGSFSWLFGSVVAVITPLLAESLAKREYARLRTLLWKSGAAGAAVTTPLAVLGIIFAGQLLGLVDPSYEQYGELLVALIAARLLDAATGAVAEALILGEHARWEFFNQLASTAALAVTAVALEPSLGVLALALASAASVIVANIGRFVEVWWLLANRWKPVGVTA